MEMDGKSEWSPDDPPGVETFDQEDEAVAEEDRLDPDFDERIAADPGLDPGVLVDERELEELGLGLDDPESMAMLQGGGDDPDGMGGPISDAKARLIDEDGWDLDDLGEPVDRSNDLRHVESPDD